MAAVVNNKVVIRSPTLVDLDRLMVIENRCFRAHRFTKKDFEYHFTNTSSIFRAAEVAGEVIGYIAGIIYHGPKQNVAKLYSMAVLPTWRKRGVGSLLLKCFEREAAKKGCILATLEVRKTNRSAQTLYKRFGFEITDVLPDYYAPGSDGLRMRKFLSSSQRLTS